MSESSGPAGSFAYDEVAYPTPIISMQIPDELGAAVLLQGLLPAAAETASVLEIGCGTGFNVLAGAAMYPAGRYAGFDLSASAVAVGAKLASEAGLTNVTLEHGDILTWPRDGELFDFITCHGVYTWIPGHVREPLLELVRARLAPGGVAYISYDCLPAAATKASIVPFLRQAVSGIEGMDEQVDAAGAILAALASNQRSKSRLKPTLDFVAEGLANYPRGYFFHDWLAEFYAPSSLQDFADAADRQGLAFVGDSHLRDLYEHDLDEAGHDLLKAAGHDRLSRNVVLDLLRGDHQFRHDLLVRQDAPPAACADSLPRLRFSFAGDRTERDEGGRTLVRYALRRASFETFGTREIAVMDAIHDARPGRPAFQELLPAAGGDEPFLRALIWRMAILGVIDSHAAAPRFTLDPGERPRAGGLVRASAAHLEKTITLRPSQLPVPDPVSRIFLRLCDGTRSSSEIAAAMSAELGGEVSLDNVATAIRTFARQGVFEA